MPIKGCLSTTTSSNAPVAGSNAVYSTLSSDSIILVKDLNGNINYGTNSYTYFNLYDSGVLVDLDLANFSYEVEAGTTLNATATLHSTNKTASTIAYEINLSISDIITSENSFYIDLKYLYNGIVYKNRWNIDLVKDGSDNDKLIYSAPQIQTLSSDLSYSYTPAGLERTALQIATQGMFKYKGDVIKLAFSNKFDSVVGNITNYSYKNGLNNITVKIGNNNIFKKSLPFDTSEIARYEIVLTAINGSETTPFLYNQQIQLKVQILGYSGVYGNMTTYVAGVTSLADSPSIMIPNTNLGTIKIGYVYFRGKNETNKNISFWGVTLEQFSNKNII